MRFKKIYIEISDICGLSCSFCPAPKNVRGIMPLDLFDRAVSEAKKHTNLIALHILGDPLKMANIRDYLEIAKNAALHVEITTSGAYLSDFEFLLNPPIHQVNISLDAVIECKNAKKILQKIYDFCDFRRNYPTSVFINLRVQNIASNKGIIEELERKFGITIKNLRTRIFERVILDIREQFSWNLPHASFQAQNKRLMPTKTRRLRAPLCYGLISHVGILANGDVVPCCIDVMGQIKLGNIYTQNIDEILCSSRVRGIRDGFMNNICHEKFCQTCAYIEAANK